MSMTKFLVLSTTLEIIVVAILAILLFRGSPRQLRIRRLVFACLTVFWMLKAAVQHHFWLR